MSATGRMLKYRNQPVALLGMGNFWVLADPAIDYEDMLGAYAGDGCNMLRASLNPHSVAVRVGIDDSTLIYPFQRSATPGANDGGNKFDCTLLNDAYFNRLDAIQAYAYSVDTICLWIMWDEIAIENASRRWHYSPYNPDNNVQSFGISGATGVADFYDLTNNALLTAQELHMQRVLDTIGHYDNLILSHSNEYTGENVLGQAGTDWAQHWQDFIDTWEAANNGSIITQDLVYGGGNWTVAKIDAIFDTHSLDAIHNHPSNPRLDWPLTGKVIPVINQRLNPKWNDDLATAHRHLWWCFVNGSHTGDDSHDGVDPVDQHNSVNMLAARNRMSIFRTFINKLSNINAMVPSYDVRENMCVIGGSSKDVLRCDPSWEYVVYMDGATSVNVDLQDGSGTFQTEWLDTVNGTMVAGSTVQGGATRTISGAPYADSVLWIHK